jgi:hypothetical protein
MTCIGLLNMEQVETFHACIWIVPHAEGNYTLTNNDSVLQVALTFKSLNGDLKFFGRHFRISARHTGAPCV